MGKSCSYIPVNEFYIIARYVLPHFAERHTPSLEGGMVLSGKNVIAQTFGFDLDPPYLFQYFCSGHHLIQLVVEFYKMIKANNSVTLVIAQQFQPDKSKIQGVYILIRFT